MTAASDEFSGTDLIAPDPGLAPAILVELERHAERARGAYAENTERAVRADIFGFTAWCTEAGVVALPATPDTVAAFIDAMAEKKAPATIRRYIASISAFHKAGGVESPTRSTDVTLALKRMHRTKGRAQAQAAPLNRKRIERMLDSGGDSSRDRRDRALLAVAYDTLCRRSELVALRVDDLEHGPAGDGTIAVRRGKTDPEGAGTVRYLAPDTMRYVAAWLEVADNSDGR